VTTTSPERPRRTYNSDRRRRQAEETRELVVAAATRLFGERGWSATGMRDVAKEAGVSVETVYANFRSKGDLLVAAVDVGVVGDAAAVPLAERREFAALADGSSAERVAAAARLLTAINRRTAGLRGALTEAAGGDASLRARLHELETRRRETSRVGIGLVVGGPVPDLLLDQLWVVTGVDAYLLLTRHGGHGDDDYEAWLGATIQALLERS
jgi:AcrR family transcriptional regulator